MDQLKAKREEYAISYKNHILKERFNSKKEAEKWALWNYKGQKVYKILYIYTYE